VSSLGEDESDQSAGVARARLLRVARLRRGENLFVEAGDQLEIMGGLRARVSHGTREAGKAAIFRHWGESMCSICGIAGPVVAGGVFESGAVLETGGEQFIRDLPGVA